MFAILRLKPAHATLATMPTTSPKKKTARRVAATSAARRAPLPASPRLVPPPGLRTREALADYPAPSSDFNAAAVETLVAARACR